MGDIRDTIQAQVHRLVGFGDGGVDLTRPPGDDGLFGPESAAWRVMLGVPALPALAFSLLLLGIPESPRWLVKRHRREDAEGVLTRLGHEDPQALVKEIAESLHEETVAADEPFFRRKYRRPILLALMVATFNQLSGINAVLYYLNDIFAAAGFDKVSGDLQSVAIGSTNLLCTIIAMSVIDRFGRKKMLLVGSVGTAICLAGVGVVFLSGRHQDLLVWFLVGFIGFFGFSQGAVIWVYISEVFPNRVRAKGQSLGSFTHWFMNALIAWTFPMMAAASGGYPFLFFAAMMALQFFVVLWTFPETKGVTLEEMQRKLGIA